MPDASLMLDDGQWATPVRALTHLDYLVRRDMNRVSEPHIVARPTHIVGVLNRSSAEPLDAKILLILRLGEVSV